MAFIRSRASEENDYRLQRLEEDFDAMTLDDFRKFAESFGPHQFETFEHIRAGIRARQPQQGKRTVKIGRGLEEDFDAMTLDDFRKLAESFGPLQFGTFERIRADIRTRQQHQRRR
jgi:hypothetical protein